MNKLRLIALLVICIKLTTALSEFELDCKEIESNSPHYQLKRYLFCEYDASIRPGTVHKNTTVVIFFLVMRKMDFDVWDSVLHMHTWLYMEWKDYHLVWNPEEHNEITTMNVKTTEVWTPEIFSLDPNSGDMGETVGSGCRLSHKGGLVCAPTVQYTLPCKSDFTYWPYETYNCSIRLGAWAYLEEEVKFANETYAVRQFPYTRNEWLISRPYMEMTTEKSKLSNDKHFQTLSLYFLVTRAESSLKTAVIVPVILLMIVTLTALWLRPGSTERLILCCVDILGHFLAQRNAHWNLPSTGASVPNIMIFYDNSLILATITLIITCILHKLLCSQKEVPVWLGSKVSIVLTSKVGQILSISFTDPKSSALLSEDNDDENSLINPATSKINKWESVVTVFGWITFFTVLFIYVVMAAVLLQ